MAIEEIKIPKLGVEMQSATIDEWLVQEGGTATKGDDILVVQTEKVTYEIEAPKEGYIHIVGKEGEEYEVGEIVALIADSESDYQEAQSSAGQSPTDTSEARDTPEVKEETKKEIKVEQQSAPANNNSTIARATPLARKIAKDKGIDLKQLNGTGPTGAVVKKDVLNAIENLEQQMEDTTQVSDSAVDNQGKQIKKVEKLKGMRKYIAKHMVESLTVSAQLTDINEINVEELVKLRAELNEDLVEELGFKISFNHLLIKAVAVVLKEVPILNASIIDDEIIYWEDINLGFAAAVDNGLVVPVIKNADKLTLAEIAQEFNSLAEKAKNGSLSQDEMSGGTFTVTNVGSYGSYVSTPILNQPEVGILGIGKITKKPIVKNDSIVIGDMLGYSLTFDHRLIDGAVGGEFQNKFVKLMENPKLLLVK